MRLLWKWIGRYGIPAALYTDRKNVYVPSRAQERGTAVTTQFGRACQKLGIRIITAKSPQAKGRVESSNGTYQDRLVKELRLAGISIAWGVYRSVKPEVFCRAKRACRFSSHCFRV
jgi:hypothetical protein